MRIQHNIMAMNAYRNYNNNTSALSKNLEKLSSGYKINRAGDDAAGLAISEKMRAQISGLEAATKNVKDGVSLVKTAEGAMQEVQDMLNRMDYLATQSANGTYDNEVDRANLQKEVDALKTEINRIADSANFNGIKLLDGSLDKTADLTTSGNFELPDVGTILGTNTVVHNTANNTDGTVFSVDLHNFTFSNATGEKLTIKIGTDQFTLDGAGGTELKAEDIADKFATSTDFKDDAGTALTAGEATIGGQKFNVTASGSTLTFTQAAAPTSDADTVSGDMAVTVSGAGTAGTAAVAAVYSFDLTGGTTTGLNGKQIDGETITWNADLDTTMGDFVTAYNAATHDYTAAWAGNKLTLTAKTAGAVAVDPVSDINDVTGAGGADVTAATEDVAGADAGAAGAASGKGDYNFYTTNVTNVTASGADRLASTKIDLAADMVKDGASITIGKESYVFKTEADSKVTAGANQKLVDVSDLDPKSTSYLSDVAAKLTAAAAGNTTYTVGHNGTDGSLSIVEKVGQTDYADADGNSTLTTKDAISATLSYKGVPTTGGALTLQIGDTSDSYNQLAVNVEDIHTAALGIEDLDISTQEGAQAAIDVIKKAINSVSSTRGTLGATQNRLEHTQNNLSVMTENITDAESTIRDTDIADEMMAYTKNNILIQSAQAMLAQANAVPQGVLQLLQ